ncbi:MAG TPA: OmpA family protein [Candidatus Sulfotelmatobacter sp.]|nr:OmpA family protein [Candidatus Sulfotelmatobacter sp.]
MLTKCTSIRRRSRLLCLFAVAIVLLFLIPRDAFAQNDTNPKWDIFAGYQYFHPGITVPTAFGDPNNPIPFKVPDMTKGFGAALTYNFDPHWGAEFDLGENWGNGNDVTTVSFGPRFIWRTDDANFFLHALVGLNRLSVPNLNEPNGPGIILGGGMDLPITKSIALRLFEADYVWARQNYSSYASPSFPGLRHPSEEGVRLRTGLVFSWGGAPTVVPAASCSVQPTEVMVGEPITATVTPSNFNPKHTLTYSWSGNGGQVTGKDTSATIDTNNVAPGSYTVTAHVTDAKLKKGNEASCTATYTVKPLPPKNPPTMSLSANPTSLVPGGTVNVSASCTSPDGVPVSVANWTSTVGTVSGTANSATLNTAGLPPGPVTVTATCTDSRGLTGQASTQVTIENPPPPPVDKALEARLALHSVYFATAQPTPKDPNGGLLPSQQKILLNLATDFKKYLEAKPDTHLVLEGHADIRGAVAFNQALSERRVARVKSFLVEQGVPEANIETKAFGAQHNLTTDEVKQSIEQNTELTTEERKRALARIAVIKLASNRRVDITLNSAGQTETSVRQFPFNAADALSLIGGRESEAKKKPAKRAPKKPAKKQ